VDVQPWQHMPVNAPLQEKLLPTGELLDIVLFHALLVKSTRNVVEAAE
jgi:hypothetical protein